jgi:hypothetical protein
MTIEPDLMRSLAALSQPHPAKCECKPDMREKRSRKLKSACHPSHISRGWDRRSSRFGSYRDFTSGAFVRALQLKDDEFDELVTALTVAKKFNNSYTTTPTAVAA